MNINPATIRIITPARIKYCRKREFILYDSDDAERKSDEKNCFIEVKNSCISKKCMT